MRTVSFVNESGNFLEKKGGEVKRKRKGKSIARARCDRDSRKEGTWTGTEQIKIVTIVS